MSTQATPPAYLKRSQYAAHIGRSPGYITQLAAQGRVVFTPDGRFVDVAKTNALLAQTADPAKQPVADRHAAARQAAADLRDADHDVQRHLPPNEPDPDHTASEYNFQGAKAKREHFAALEAEASYRQKIKELLEASEVRAVLAEIITVLRTRLEAIPYSMAPQLAATSDEVQVKALLTAEIEHALKTASESLAKLGKGGA